MSGNDEKREGTTRNGTANHGGSHDGAAVDSMRSEDRVRAEDRTRADDRPRAYERARSDEGTRAAEPTRSLMDPEASVRDLLKDHDLRYSRPREAILGYLHEGHSHLSAEALYLALKHRGEDLSLSTVYLNLGVLTEAGLIREFRGANGESLYDRNVSPHYHLICNVTGEVRDVPQMTIEGMPLGRFLKEKIEEATGWTVDEPQLHLRGVSPDAESPNRLHDDS